MFCGFVFQVNKTNVGGKTYSGEATSDSQNGSSLSSGFPRNYGSVPSGSTDSMSPTSTLTSLCEDADSGKSVMFMLWLSHLIPLINMPRL